jgi:hypothetical protein
VIKLIVVIIKVGHFSAAHKIVSSVLAQMLTQYADDIIGEVDFKKSHDSVRRCVLYNILTAFGITIKTGDIIKTC